MRILLLVLVSVGLASGVVAPFETGDMLGGAYVDTHTIDTVVLSTFTHYGAGQEWSKYSGSDTAYDTTWAGATAVKIKSTNFTGMKIIKTFDSPKDFSSYNRFRLNCSFTARDSLVYIYLSTNNFTGYAYRACKPSLTQVSANETFILSFDRPDFAVAGSGFSWSNVDKIRVDFQAGSGHTNYMTVWKLSAEKSTLSKAVLMLTFDDGHVSVFDNARSILSTRGIKAAISTCTDPAFMADSTNYLNLRKLDSLKADGNIIVNHGKTHSNLNTITLDSVRKELAYSDSFIIANNLDTKGKIHIYPYGGAADSVRGVASSYLSIGFSTETWPTKYINMPTRDKLLIPRYLVGNSETVRSAKAPLDSAVIYKYPVAYGFHAISNSTSYGSKWAADSFSIFCDSVKAKVDAGVLDVKLPTQYYTWRKDTTINDGSNFTFRVSYGGTTPSYQWQKNGSNITGATTSNYTAASQYASDNGAVYKCVVSNSAGTVTSSDGVLTVTPVSPAVIGNPANKRKKLGATATFSVTATGTATLSYQWQNNSGGSYGNIAGATSASYTTPAIASSDNGVGFKCIVSNGTGTATSSVATLTVGNTSGGNSGQFGNAFSSGTGRGFKGAWR